MHQKVCLLVENDPFQLRDLANLISENNLTVYLARDTEQGAEVLQSQSIDLVMCDLYMEHEDTSAITILKQHASSLPLIAVAKRSEKRIPTRVALTKARAHGADFIMESPFDGDKFTKLVELAEKYVNNGGRLSHAMLVGCTSPILDKCQQILEDREFRVTRAKDLREALNVTCPLDVDVIISRFCGNDKDCRELVAQLSQYFPGVGIVSIGEAEAEKSNDALRLGATTTYYGELTENALTGAIRNAQIIAHSNLLRAAYLELNQEQASIIAA